jgi:hypothetical protein
MWLRTATRRFTSWISESLAMKISVSTAILLSAFCLGVSQTHAQTIKKWVDEEGVTHYSDREPVNDGAEVRDIEIQPEELDDFESDKVNERINRQLQQMQEDREAREREAEAAEKARAAEESLRREPIVGEEKKKNKDRDRNYRGPFPKPLPGPFPEKYPRPGSLNPPGS